MICPLGEDDGAVSTSVQPSDHNNQHVSSKAMGLGDKELQECLEFAEPVSDLSCKNRLFVQLPERR